LRTLTRDKMENVTCTNAYPVGSLIIQKNVDKAYENDEWPTDPEITFGFTIVRTDKVLVEDKTYPVYMGDEPYGDVTVKDGKLLVDIPFTDFTTKEIRIENLPKGNYTVEETNCDSRFTQSLKETTTSISPEDYVGTATFTNTYTKHKGDLKITKTVDQVGTADIPADAEFTFTVSGKAIIANREYTVTIGETEYKIKADNQTNLTVRLKAGETAVIHDLNTDAYTLTETMDNRFVQKSVVVTNAGSKGTSSVINANTGDNDVTTHDFTNTYVPRGNLKVTKYIDRGVFHNIPYDEVTEFAFTVTLDYSVDKAETYTAKTYSSDGEELETETLTLSSAKTLTFTLKHGQYIVIEGLPAVNYTITETPETGYKTSDFQGDETGAIPYNGTKEVTCYNPLELLPGDLSIQKTINDTSPNQFANKKQPFVFTVTLWNVVGTPSQSYKVTYSCDTTKGECHVIDGETYYTTIDGTQIKLPTTIELEGLDIPTNGTAPDSGDVSNDGTVPDGGDKPDDSYITPGDDALLDGEYRLELTLYDGLIATILDLPPSSYYVEEADYGEQGFAATYTGQQGFVGGIVVDGKEPYTMVTCTNTYTGLSNGILKIEKQVTKDYERDVLPGDTFTFTVIPTDGVVLSGDYNVKLTGVYPANSGEIPEETTDWTVTAEDNKLVVEISFTAEELKELALNDSRAKLLSVEGLPLGQYSITENADEDYVQHPNLVQTDTVGSNPGEVVFTNEYRRHLGTLTINKSVTGTNEQDTFIFHISGNGVKMDVAVKAGQSVTVYDLPLGSYTVTEDTSWSWRYDQTASDETDNTITLNDLHANFTFTNNCEKPEWLNFIFEKLNSFTVSSPATATD